MFNKEEIAVNVIQRRGRKRKSLVDLSVELLTDEQRSVHVDELVELLMDRYGRVTDRDLFQVLWQKKHNRVFWFGVCLRQHLNFSSSFVRRNLW